MSSGAGVKRISMRRLAMAAGGARYARGGRKRARFYSPRGVEEGERRAGAVGDVQGYGGAGSGQRHRSVRAGPMASGGRPAGACACAAWHRPAGPHASPRQRTMSTACASDRRSRKCLGVRVRWWADVARATSCANTRSQCGFASV
jgi:hypothetical protein